MYDSYYLKRCYEPYVGIPPLYEELVDELKDVLGTLPHYKNMRSYFGLTPYVGESGVGLRVINKIRNKLAHGSLAIPHLGYDDDVEALDARLINICSRLVLLTLQMFVLAHFRKSPVDVFELELFVDEIPVEFNMFSFLRFLHIDSDE